MSRHKCTSILIKINFIFNCDKLIDIIFGNNDNINLLFFQVFRMEIWFSENINFGDWTRIRYAFFPSEISAWTFQLNFIVRLAPIVSRLVI